MRLREELQRELGLTPEIRLGWPSQFVVLADGKVLFARWGTGRLPEPGEIARRLRDEADVLPK